MGLLNRHDSTMFRSFFKEMAKLVGIHVFYQYPIDMKLTIYAEENPTGFSENIEMDIIFTENPKTQTLRKYGWVSELPEDKPFIAELPFDAKNLCVGCRIIIPPPEPLVGNRVFVITDIKSNLEFPDSWICKLAPVFFNKQDKKLQDYKNANNVFMNLGD